MAFRSPDNVQKNELVRFQLESNIRAPANTAEQQKNGYKFIINDRGTFYDWFNACIIYDTDNLHLVTFAKNLLEYLDDYARSVAKNSLWYLDTDATSDNTNTGLEARRLLTASRKLVNVTIPLNRYSFF